MIELTEFFKMYQFYMEIVEKHGVKRAHIFDYKGIFALTHEKVLNGSLNNLTEWNEMITLLEKFR